MVSNLSTESGLSGRTRQQDIMSRAFSPANNNRQNMQEEELSIRPEKSGVVKAEEAKQVQESVTGVPASAQQQRGVQSAAGMPEIQAMLGNLGIFNIGLTAGVNTFVNSAPFSSANAQLTKGGTPIFNQATGKWELPQAAEVQAQTGGLVAEKLGQQQDLRNMAGDMFNENGTAKTFEQVLSKFGDRNGDGTIDAQEQAWLNEAFGLVNAIRRLRNENPYSADAQALRAQLSAKDRNGMVSGLIEALDQYEEIVNKRVTGAEAEAYYLKDLLTMGQDKIEQEVQKALTASSGLFGSDYETYLQREVDKSAQEYQDAAEEDASVMQVIKDVSDAWLRAYEGEFRKAKDTLNSMFRGSADALKADLDTLSKSDQKGAKGVKQAMEWFVDTQTLVNTGNKDFGDIVFQALVDSPLGAESKRIIKKWLGETIGFDVAEKGVLAKLLEKIGSTGYFWTEDANGNQVQVYLNAQQKMDVVRIINDPNKNDNQKIDEIEGLISSMSKGMGTRLEQDLSTVVTPIRSGKLASSLSAWKGAMTESFRGFDDSLTQNGYTSVVNSMGRNNAPQVMQAAIEQHAQKKLDEISSALNEINKEIGTLEKRVSSDMQLLQQHKASTAELQTKGREAVSVNYGTGLDYYIKEASTPGTDYTVDGKPVSLIRAMWINQNSSPPPANLETVYAPVKAAQGMVKNLKGTSTGSQNDPYVVLLRDYFGGNEADINKLITQNIFLPETAALANKAIEAFRSLSFTDTLWQGTPAGQDVAKRQSEIDSTISEAQAKIAEAEAAKRALQASYDQAVRALQTSTLGAKMEVAQAYNAAVDGNFGPLTSNVPNETANRLFNMAIEGQSMPFQQMPKVDIEALRKTGNIQFTERGNALNPAGLGKYVNREWVPAGSKIAISLPKTQTKVEQTIPTGEVKPGTTQAPAPTQPQPRVWDPPDTDSQRNEYIPPGAAPVPVDYTPTDNPNTGIVTLSNGEKVVVNVVQTPRGPVLVEEGGLTPTYPPAGTVKDADRLSTDPNHPDNRVAIPPRETTQQPEQQGWLERILESIKPGFMQPTAKEKTEETANRTAEVMIEKQAKVQGKSDAKAGIDPRPGQPEAYYDEYNATAAEEILKSRKQNKVVENNEDTRSGAERTSEESERASEESERASEESERASAIERHRDMQDPNAER